MRDVGPGSAGPAETPWIAAARQSVADQLCAAASRATLTDAVVERLQEAGRLLGVDIVSGTCVLEHHDIGAILEPGARICFTGTAQDATGRIVEREEMERLAQKAGLAPVKSVTKTRCEVLVTAEAGSQSGKARKAQEFGKPVFSADEFFAWLAGRESSTRRCPGRNHRGCRSDWASRHQLEMSTATSPCRGAKPLSRVASCPLANSIPMTPPPSTMTSSGTKSNCEAWSLHTCRRCRHRAANAAANRSPAPRAHRRSGLRRRPLCPVGELSTPTDDFDTMHMEQTPAAR